jgi:hypothetical protein
MRRREGCMEECVGGCIKPAACVEMRDSEEDKFGQHDWDSDAQESWEGRERREREREKRRRARRRLTDEQMVVGIDAKGIVIMHTHPRIRIERELRLVNL